MASRYWNLDHKARWKRLYRFARLTRDINPGMRRDMLNGIIRPCLALFEIVDEVLA